VIDQDELQPGTRVVCRYRPTWTGVIEAAGEDPAFWNGRNSEAQYCRNAKVTRVRYPFGVMHDFTSDLSKERDQ
jgi:hypothetical protein